MIHIIFNQTVSHPTLRQEFLDMAYDCRQTCYPLNPTHHLANKLKEWVKDWFECQEIACIVNRPLPNRQAESIPSVEQMFQLMLIEVFTTLDFTSWMQLASWWLHELEKTERDNREAILMIAPND